MMVVGLRNIERTLLAYGLVNKESYASYKHCLVTQQPEPVPSLGG
jgi:hypothetical protein